MELTNNTTERKKGEGIKNPRLAHGAIKRTVTTFLRMKRISQLGLCYLSFTY